MDVSTGRLDIEEMENNTQVPYLHLKLTEVL